MPAGAVPMDAMTVLGRGGEARLKGCSFSFCCPGTCYLSSGFWMFMEAQAGQELHHPALSGSQAC